MNPKEQVGNPTDIATENIVLLSPQNLPTLFEASHDQEVACEPQEVLTEPEPQTNDDISGIVNSPCRYQLPLRSKRGIPPRRYDPEFESQRSRYPINREASNLAQTAVAFQTSLYSSSLPKSTEEALRNPRWKEAMVNEISALKKNSTWKKCMLPEGKKPIGSKWVLQ